MKRKPLIQVTVDPELSRLIELLTPSAPPIFGRKLRLFLELTKSPAIRSALIDEAHRRGWVTKETP